MTKSVKQAAKGGNPFAKKAVAKAKGKQAKAVAKAPPPPTAKPMDPAALSAMSAMTGQKKPMGGY